MSLIGNISGDDKYPAVKFSNVGDAVAGVIVATEDYQEKEFGDDPKKGVRKGDPKFFESGDPIMAVRITLETNPGDASSRVNLYAQGARMLKAIAKAVKATGAADLELGGELAVTHTGRDGNAKAYESAYARPDAA